MVVIPFSTLISSIQETTDLGKSILDKIIYEIQGFSFLRRNLRATRALTAMQKDAYHDYRFTGLTKADVAEMDNLHKLVREGRGLNFWRKTYLKRHGEKVCAVAYNQDDLLVGFNYYYFRESEVKDAIIHDAYLGITPNEWGKGLATALQTYAVEQFSRQPLTGVSGNVSKANQPSVKMLLRVGFTLSDDPKDPTNYNIFYPLPGTHD